MRNTKGFTLIEIVIVLSIMAILAGLFVPLAVRYLKVSRISNTKEEIQQLLYAILGDPAIGNPGYVGDTGTLPGSLDDLVTNPGLPASLPQTNGVQIGWDGPYINTGINPDDFKTDEWDNPYDYGVVGNGQIRSNGPDSLPGTSDDIIFPPEPVDFTGNLTMNVFVSKIDRIPNRAPLGKTIVATFFYSNNGTEASNSVTNTDTSTNSFLFKSDILPFPNVHPGTHAVKVELKNGTNVEKTVMLNVDIPINGGTNKSVFIR